MCTRLDELAACLRSQEEELEDEDCDDIVEEERSIPGNETYLDHVPEACEVDTEDKETNTECVFLPEKGSKRREESRAAMVIKRSQTFSPSAAVAKSQYVCRVSNCQFLFR